MITDLENIVISYLDPDSYKILQQYNPMKYNKLKQIQTQYEKIIPDIIRDNIVETGVILSSEIKSAKIKSADPPYAIQQLTFAWFKSRIDELLIEYRKLDQNIIKAYNIRIDPKPVIFFNPNITYEDYSIANYGLGILTPEKLTEYKDLTYLIDSISKAKDLMSYESRDKYLAFINSLEDPFTQEIKNELSESINLQHLEIIADRFNTLDITSVYNNYLEKINKCEQYYQKKLFTFTSFDPELMKCHDHISMKEPQLPENFRQCLYNIMETVDHFIRIIN